MYSKRLCVIPLYTRAQSSLLPFSSDTRITVHGVCGMPHLVAMLSFIPEYTCTYATLACSVFVHDILTYGGTVCGNQYILATCYNIYLRGVLYHLPFYSVGRTLCFVLYLSLLAVNYFVLQ